MELNSLFFHSSIYVFQQEHLMETWVQIWWIQICYIQCQVDPQQQLQPLPKITYAVRQGITCWVGWSNGCYLMYSVALKSKTLILLLWVWNLFRCDGLFSRTILNHQLVDYMFNSSLCTQKANKLKRFYYNFQHYVDLVMWKVMGDLVIGRKYSYTRCPHPKKGEKKK